MLIHLALLIVLLLFPAFPILAADGMGSADSWSGHAGYSNPGQRPDGTTAADGWDHQGPINVDPNAPEYADRGRWRSVHAAQYGQWHPFSASAHQPNDWPGWNDPNLQ